MNTYHLALAPMRTPRPRVRKLFRWRAAFRPVHKPIYFSTVRCPHCGKWSRDQMPGNASVYFYRCVRCNTMFTPLPGDCCVYCSYGDVPCPWAQRASVR